MIDVTDGSDVAVRLVSKEDLLLSVESLRRYGRQYQSGVYSSMTLLNKVIIIAE